MRRLRQVIMTSLSAMIMGIIPLAIPVTTQAATTPTANWTVDVNGNITGRDANNYPNQLTWNVGFNSTGQDLGNASLVNTLSPGQAYVPGSVTATTGTFNADGSFSSTGGHELTPTVTVNGTTTLGQQLTVAFSDVNAPVAVYYRTTPQVSGLNGNWMATAEVAGHASTSQINWDGLTDPDPVKTPTSSSTTSSSSSSSSSSLTTPAKTPTSSTVTSHATTTVTVGGSGMTDGAGGGVDEDSSSSEPMTDGAGGDVDEDSSNEIDSSSSSHMTDGAGGGVDDSSDESAESSSLPSASSSATMPSEPSVSSSASMSSSSQPSQSSAPVTVPSESSSQASSTPSVTVPSASSSSVSSSSAVSSMPGISSSAASSSVASSGQGVLAPGMNSSSSVQPSQPVVGGQGATVPANNGTVAGLPQSGTQAAIAGSQPATQPNAMSSGSAVNAALPVTATGRLPQTNEEANYAGVVFGGLMLIGLGLAFVSRKQP
ncbi:collagen binding domain-containing protein [Levilactobacillus zymae]|uniref:collagen binding domain-containing protein n=1 Tax=Levilactobacillus zymae TaxID=267363 RepID=UPI0028B8C72E|nr:collagen binding domain-containing protein [Levilactobacillus zymae]MDT6981344.1 collagen binding domain-containing protein [Levilactobacillus zymae]